MFLRRRRFVLVTQSLQWRNRRSNMTDCSVTISDECCPPAARLTTLRVLDHPDCPRPPCGYWASVIWLSVGLTLRAFISGHSVRYTVSDPVSAAVPTLRRDWTRSSEMYQDIITCRSTWLHAGRDLNERSICSPFSHVTAVECAAADAVTCPQVVLLEVLL